MRHLFVIILLLVPAIGSAQIEPLWVARYNGIADSTDSVDDMFVAENGNVYITGRTRDSDTTYDIVTIMYNSAGESLWVAPYNSPVGLYDIPYGMAVDNAGNVYVTGGSQITPLPLVRYDYVTIKYDSAGEEQWVRTYDNPDNHSDVAQDIAVANNGNVYVTGQSYTYETNEDWETIAYDSTGDTLWMRRYYGVDSTYSGEDYAWGIAVDNDSNVYVTGSTRIPGYGDNIASIKYNNSGGTEWVAYYDGPILNGSDKAYYIALFDGYLYVAGNSQGTSYCYDYVTIKYNTATGDSVWVRRYDGSGNDDDYAADMVVDAAGNVYITGKSEGDGTYDDFATIKYDSAGTKLWVARYEGPDSSSREGAAGVAVDSAGNVYVTGWTINGFSDNWDYLTVKYNSAGEEQWVAVYNGPDSLSDIPIAIGLDSWGYVYVTGSSEGVGTEYDFATLKYSATGVAESRDNKVRNAKLEVYPNPFSKTTIIRYAITENRNDYTINVSLKMYDLSGRLVKSIYEGRIEAGTHELKLDGTDLVPGIYFIRLTTDNSTLVNKLTILR